MNLPANYGLGGTEPEWVTARAKFFEVMDKHNKPYGGFAFANPPYGSSEAFQKSSERMSFMCITGDVVHLMNMATDLKQAKELVAAAREEKLDAEGVTADEQKDSKVNGEEIQVGS